MTVVKGDQKAPFSIATTLRCRGGCYSFPRIAPLYPWYLPYARWYQVPFSKSLVWCNLGLNPGLPDHCQTLYPQGFFFFLVEFFSSFSFYHKFMRFLLFFFPSFFCYLIYSFLFPFLLFFHHSFIFFPSVFSFFNLFISLSFFYFLLSSFSSITYFVFLSSLQFFFFFFFFHSFSFIFLL